MQIGTACIGPIDKERLIIASGSSPNARAEMQHLRYAVDLAIDRRHARTSGEGYIFIPGEAGEKRSVSSRWETLAENAGRKIDVRGVIGRHEADLPLDVPGVDERCTLHGIDEAIAGFIFERVGRLEITGSEEHR